jgi:hypothetical protein
VEFLNLASDVKFKSNDIRSKFKRAIGWHDELARMRAFLKESAQPFTTDLLPEWAPAAHVQQGTEHTAKSTRKRRPRSQAEDAA